MGFSKTTIFLLSLIFIVLHSHNLVSADQSLIQKECQNSQVPYICLQCLKSDPNSEATDSKGIASILMNCLSIEADTLSGNMSDLGSSERDHTRKTVFQECVEDYASAKHDLVAAKVALMNNNVGEALRCVANAAKADAACHEAILMYVFRMPKGRRVFYRMMAYDELSETVKRIIESLKE